MSSAVALDLTSTTGYLVADARGRVIGRVEAPMYGTSPDVPDALAVRSGCVHSGWNCFRCSVTDAFILEGEATLHVWPQPSMSHVS